MPKSTGTQSRGTIRRVEADLMRGAGSTAVLKLLQRRAMYGYELVETLAASTEGVLAMGQSTLYPLLYNLEGKGLIAAEWRSSDSGRDRKYYALTKKGERRLRESEEQWRGLVSAMRGLGVVTIDGGTGLRGTGLRGTGLRGTGPRGPGAREVPA